MATRVNVGGWLQGKTIKKSGVGSSSHTRSSTPQQVQSTSTTVFGGGVKDASGRVTEYFVSCSCMMPQHKLTRLGSLWTTNVLFVRVTAT